MVTRVINLVNNFYTDSKEGSSTQNNRQELGEYCCLGYFDALDVELIDCENPSDMDILRKVDQYTIGKLNGKSSRRNVICITNNDEKDKKFWEAVKGKPFLFISLIRIKYDEEGSGDQNNNLEVFIDKINKNEDEMAYYTYGHSDMVVFKYENQYLGNGEIIRDEFQYKDIFKMYSIFAIKEEVLENGEGIDNSNVRCRLQAVVKNMDDVETYIKELQNTLELNAVHDNLKIKHFYALGGSDIMIDIPKVSLKKLLKCYKMGELLTHTNDFYEKAFFNVESAIFNIENNSELSSETGGDIV